MRADFAAQQIRFAAIAVLGDRAVATGWIGTLNEALSGIRPAPCAQTKGGLIRVLGVLNAVETGVVL